MDYEHNFKGNADGMDMEYKGGPVMGHGWDKSLDKQLNLNTLPDPDMTGCDNWCEECSKMSTPNHNGECKCGNKIANIGIKGTSNEFN